MREASPSPAPGLAADHRAAHARWRQRAHHRRLRAACALWQAAREAGLSQEPSVNAGAAAPVCLRTQRRSAVWAPSWSSSSPAPAWRPPARWLLCRQCSRRPRRPRSCLAAAWQPLAVVAGLAGQRQRRWQPGRDWRCAGWALDCCRQRCLPLASAPRPCSAHSRRRRRRTSSPVSVRYWSLMSLFLMHPPPNFRGPKNTQSSGDMTHHEGRGRRLSYTLAATAPPAQHALSSAC
jgi:hypothetical protein